MSEQIIFETQLPSLEGYVETEVDGERVYQKVGSTPEYLLESLVGFAEGNTLAEKTANYAAQMQAREEAYNSTVKSQAAALAAVTPMILVASVESAGGSYDKARSVVNDLAPAADFLEAKDWEAGMTTQPGDLVYDPEHNYVYAYTGATAMTHSNPTFYPGAAGVYYWAIVPRCKDGIKIYPNIEGIIVYVKHGEKWWDTEREHVYSWNGVDNPNCVWPPMPGNEWTLVE